MYIATEMLLDVVIRDVASGGGIQMMRCSGKSSLLLTDVDLVGFAFLDAGTPPCVFLLFVDSCFVRFCDVSIGIFVFIEFFFSEAWMFGNANVCKYVQLMTK
ncbi:hypothetical protein Btru_075754 [Bulinus truncatus]|nr:hypothetical protein Btru_075754 [Bulinus truncatus]